jgi:hypothetical protein
MLFVVPPSPRVGEVWRAPDRNKNGWGGGGRAQALPCLTALRVPGQGSCFWEFFRSAWFVVPRLRHQSLQEGSTARGWSFRRI